MKLSLHKKVLLSMGVVAGIGALAGAGTFATFTAQTSNPSNTFADGTLVLSNKVGGASACLYGGSPDAGVTCDFSDTAKTLTAFVGAYPNVGSGLGAGALSAAGGANPKTWVRVGVQLPSNADNTFQGRSASLALNWHITQ